MPFAPGQSGNPAGPPKRQFKHQRSTAVLLPLGGPPYFRTPHPSTLPQTREKQAEDLIQDSYLIAKRCGLKLHHDLDVGAKNLWDSVRAWGTAVDKVVGKVESSGLDLHVPAQFLDRFMIAVGITPKGSHNDRLCQPTPAQVTDENTLRTIDVQSVNEKQASCQGTKGTGG